MSELYRHILIPKDADFVPKLENVANFYTELRALGALPKDPNFVVIAFTRQTRRWGRNPKTGEEYYGPELKVDRFTDLQIAIDSVRTKAAFEVHARGEGPTAIPPFELCGANRPDVRWNEAFEYCVYCKLREKPSRLLCNPVMCKCEYNPVEQGIFKNPWNDADIATSGLAWARFTVEFGVGNWLWPMITDHLDILDPRLVDIATRAFGIEFTQGCITNDD
jgi:hypothetical protein